MKPNPTPKSKMHNMPFRIDEPTRAAIKTHLLKQDLSQKKPNTWQGLIENLISDYMRRHKIKP